MANPWFAENFSDFLYYCCPECEERNKSKELFVKHALEHHINSKECLQILLNQEKFYDGMMPIKCELNDDENLNFSNEFSEEMNISDNYEQKPDINEQNPYIYEQNPYVYDQKPDIYEQNPDTSEQTQDISEQKPNISEQTHDIYEQKPTKTEILIKENKYKEHVCLKCGKSYTCQTSLKYHMKVHEGIKDFKCDHCELTFTAKHSKFKHMRIVHEGIKGPKNYKCELCGKAFSKPYDLNRHGKVHIEKPKIIKKSTENQEHKCQECGKVYKSGPALRYHLKVHSGVKNYQCEDCDKAFFARCDLEKHVRTVHEGIQGI